MVQLTIGQHQFMYNGWYRGGDEPLPEQVMTQFKYAYMRHRASIC